MEEEGGPVSGCTAWCCGKGNSVPMESFTFQSKVSEVVYNSIMRSRLGLVSYSPSLLCAFFSPLLCLVGLWPCGRCVLVVIDQRVCRLFQPPAKKR